MKKNLKITIPLIIFLVTILLLYIPVFSQKEINIASAISTSKENQIVKDDYQEYLKIFDDNKSFVFKLDPFTPKYALITSYDRNNQRVVIFNFKRTGIINFELSEQYFIIMTNYDIYRAEDVIKSKNILKDNPDPENIKIYFDDEDNQTQDQIPSEILEQFKLKTTECEKLLPADYQSTPETKTSKEYLDYINCDKEVKAEFEMYLNENNF
jgi:hypothetical protein